MSAIGASIVGSNGADDTKNLQEFFDFISRNDVGTAFCSGQFSVSSGINVGDDFPMATRHIVGSVRVKATRPVDTVFLLQNTDNLVWNGRIHVVGTGATSFASRTCRTGIQIGSHPNGAARMSIDALHAEHFYGFGVDVQSPSTLTNLGDVRVSDCGSGHPPSAAFSLSAGWLDRLDSGSSGSVTQRTKIKVDCLPPENVGEVFVIIGGKAYYVYGVDRADGTLTLFPWINPTSETSGTLTYLFGGGVYVHGSDTGIISANMIDAMRCGIGALDAALYGIQGRRLVNQYCGAGFAYGANPSAAHVGNSIDGLYCENNCFDVLRNTRDLSGLNITSSYALNLDEVGASCFALTSGNTYNNANLNGVTLNKEGQLLQYQKPANNESSVSSSYWWDIFSPSGQRQVHQRDRWTVKFDIQNINNNQHFGYDSGQLTLIGSGPDRSPKGSITFVPPFGYTVNGGAAVTFSGFDGPATFHATINFNESDFIVAAD